MSSLVSRCIALIAILCVLIGYELELDYNLVVRHFTLSRIIDDPALASVVDEDPLGNDSLQLIFDLKRKSLKSKSADCFCPNGRENWIYYNHCPGSIEHNQGAGIKDRQNILRNLFWYADELCAKLAVTCTPQVWLSEEHGCFAPEDARWDTYFTPVRNSNDSFFPVDVLYWDVNVSTFKGFEKVDGEPSIQAYEAGRKLYSQNIPFVWNFNATFWNTDLYDPLHIWPQQVFNHRKYTDSCGWIDFDTTEELLNIGQLALQELNITSSQDFVTLHLRRGDYMQCNTNPWRVIKYLKCSIVDNDVKKVVVLTNGEKEYTKRLNRTFSKAFPNMQMFILDDLIESESFVEKLNDNSFLSVHTDGQFLSDNCFRFSAAKVLVSMSRYHLSLGHANCKKCDPLGSKTDWALIR